MKALGMIEVYGQIGTIEGLDSSLKAANVSLVNMIRVGAGITTFFIEGDVGAVKAAIEAASVAADKVGNLLSSHVIPRPAKEVRDMLDMSIPDYGRPIQGKNSKRDTSQKAEDQSELKHELKTFVEASKEITIVEDKKINSNEFIDTEKNSSDNNVEDAKKIEDLDLNSATVAELRRIARSYPNLDLTKKEIKFAKKEELIEAINNEINKENK